MKLASLLENLKINMLELQQKLIDALDDDFDVSLNAGSTEGSDDAYIIRIRHPLLKQPLVASVLTNGPHGPEVKVGSFIRFALFNPLELEKLIDYANAKVNVVHAKAEIVQITRWLLENSFVLTEKLDFEAKTGITLECDSFLKSQKLYIRTVNKFFVIVKVGLSSYQAVDHEFWMIDTSFADPRSTGAVGRPRRKLRTFAEVKDVIGPIIGAA